jgi:hypothetical protein
MAKVVKKSEGFTEVTLLRVAREIAMEIYPLDTILENHKLSHEDFEYVKRLPRFNELLQDAIITWHSALNTHERVKVKAAALMEEWLPELNTRMHDREEPLMSKVKAAELGARLANMGMRDVSVDDSSHSRFSVVINLGADKQIKIDKEVPKQIEHNETT